MLSNPSEGPQHQHNSNWRLAHLSVTGSEAPDAPNMEAYRAATYAALGREAQARDVIANLNVRPGEISPESWIRRWTPSQEHAQKAIEALHRMGMQNRTGAAGTTK